MADVVPQSTGFDPTKSTTSHGPSGSGTQGVDVGSTYMDPNIMKAEKPPAGSNSAVITYTFGPGLMGITLEDAQGGTRVVISDVTESSQAQRLGVPIGGIVMKVNGKTATGRRKGFIGKWLADAERPLTLQVLHPGGHAAAIADNAEAAAAAEDPFAVPANARLAQKLLHAATSLGPVDTYTLGQGALGLKGLEETENGVLVTEIAPGSIASTCGVRAGVIIVAVNGEEARMQKAAVTKQLANAERPLTLKVVALPEEQQEQRKRDSQAPAAASVAPYTFGPGPLGLTFADTPNGVVVATVTGAAEELKVPVGGVLVRINQDGVAGQSKAAIGKAIAKASRPVTIMIRTGTSPAEAAAAAAAAAATEASEAAAREAKAAASKEAKTSAFSSRTGSAGSRGGDSTARKAKKQKKGKLTSRSTPRPEKSKPEKGKSTSRAAQAPKGKKYTFGPGSLGLGLDDAPMGGVVVTEVVSGSAAAEQGIEPGGIILQLNGMDVENQGKVGLSKMIGYLPRPITLTISPSIIIIHRAEDPKDAKSLVRQGTTEQNSTATASVEGQGPAAGTSESANAASTKPDKKLKSSLKSGRKTAKAPKATALQAANAGDAQSELPKPRAKAVTISEGAELPDQSSAEQQPASVQPDGASAATPSAGEGAPTLHLEDSDADDDAEEEDGEVSDEELGTNAPMVEAAESEGQLIQPTGGTPGAEAKTSSQPAATDNATTKSIAKTTKPLEPRRAHPPPQAPIEAWPVWAVTPPPRSPRMVVGSDAKYVLKSTIEAFSHSSLVGECATNTST